MDEPRDRREVAPDEDIIGRHYELEEDDLLELLEDAMLDGVLEASDGCPVEPDGRCPHGYESPLLEWGLI